VLASLLRDLGAPLLDELDLRENQVGDLGTEVLADAITENKLPRLLTLLLWHNRIHDPAFLKLSIALTELLRRRRETADTLAATNFHIEIEGNPISHAARNAILHATHGKILSFSGVGESAMQGVEFELTIPTLRAKFLVGPSKLIPGDEAFDQTRRSFDLDELLQGSPHTNVSEGVKMDHTMRSDSDELFTPNGFEWRTTPHLEYWFVSDPFGAMAKQAKEKLGLAFWPGEARGELAKSADPAKAAQAAGEQRERIPKTIADFEDRLRDINVKLRIARQHALSEVEFTVARLYSGPMATVYNAVLSDLRAEHGSQYGGLAFQPKQAHLYKSNKYVTTLAVLHSAISKLSYLLSENVKLYRGVSDQVGAEEALLWKKRNFIGYEYACMSATTSGEHAFRHVAAFTACETVLEMHAGIATCADFSWLSMYPHECEFVFPPLTKLSVMGWHRAGNLTVVQVRPTLTLEPRTTEETSAKMKRTHLGIIEMLTNELKFSGVPRSKLAALEYRKTAMQLREAEWFNTQQNFQQANEEALSMQRDILRDLAMTDWQEEHREQLHLTGSWDSPQRMVSQDVKIGQPAGNQVLTRAMMQQMSNRELFTLCTSASMRWPRCARARRSTRRR